MPSKLQRAIGLVKDQTSISLAKVGGSTSLSDLDVAIVKATSHEEYPAGERHVREIITLSSCSRAYVSACVNALSRRLNKTKNWTVALKTLMVIHRLLAEGDPAYEQEIFFSTRRGTRILNMNDFRDSSRSNSWDFSAFVRTYALYLDESLEFKMQAKNPKRNMYRFDDEFGEEDNGKPLIVKPTPVHEMKTGQLFQRMQQLQHLLERFLASRPTGEAKCNRVVSTALYPIVKESFQIYYDMTETMRALIDRFMEVDMSDTEKIYDIFCRQGKQFDELDAFYIWCRTVGICRPSEFPEIDKITPMKLDLLDELIRDKSALEQGNISKEETNNETEEIKVPEPEEDLNAVESLPPPSENPFVEEPEKEKDEDDDNLKDIVFQVQQEADLLNLGEEAISCEYHTDQLALALFDGPALAGPLPGHSWEDLKDETDWETALVQSTSSLSDPKAELGGGFDSLLLDGMYQQGQTMAAMQSCAATGSASSVAFGSAGIPALLALPAPPSSNGCDTAHVDPFAVSLGVAPPSYVQMPDIEKKQKLLMEEQVMWDQYRMNGMQGDVGMSTVQGHPYNQGVGWYTHGY